MTYFIRLQLHSYLRRSLVFLLCFWMAAYSLPVRAQVHPLLGCAISGGTTGAGQSTYTYGISAGCTTASNWSVSCGSIVSHTGTTVTVDFNGCSTAVISALNGSGGVIVSETVTIGSLPPPPPPPPPPALDPGFITNPHQPTINYGTAAQPLIGTAASGGTCTNGYIYQWYSSTDNVNYSLVGSGQNYSPGVLYTTTSFYRSVLFCGSPSGTSNPATVDVWPQIVPGPITPANQTINNNSVPSPLSISGSTGGNGSFSYQWQSSSNSQLYESNQCRDQFAELFTSGIDSSHLLSGWSDQ